MTHPEGVLDTSTFTQLGRLDAATVPEVALINSMTLAELSIGPLLASDDDERARRQAHLQEAEADFDPLPFDADAARAFARVAASLRAGRKPAARPFDAIIAATALSRGLPLYTCNPRDFDDIEDLEVVPVRVA